MSNNNSKFDSLVWAVQRVGFQLCSYERAGSGFRGWYLAFDGEGVTLCSENTVDGVLPGALPVSGAVATRSVAVEFAQKLAHAAQLRGGEAR